MLAGEGKGENKGHVTEKLTMVGEWDLTLWETQGDSVAQAWDSPAMRWPSPFPIPNHSGIRSQGHQIWHPSGLSHMCQSRECPRIGSPGTWHKLSTSKELWGCAVMSTSAMRGIWKAHFPHDSVWLSFCISMMYFKIREKLLIKILTKMLGLLQKRKKAAVKSEKMEREVRGLST